MTTSVPYDPVDVLQGVFHFYDEREFPNDRESIHAAFYKLRSQHKIVLGQFRFRQNILFPRSRVLDEALAALQPDFLGKINPTFDKFTIKKENIDKRWALLSGMLGDKEEELKIIALELKAAIEHG